MQVEHICGPRLAAAIVGSANNTNSAVLLSSTRRIAVGAPDEQQQTIDSMQCTVRQSNRSEQLL
jgi:hypothetical protein